MQKDMYTASEVLWLHPYVRFHIFLGGRCATTSTEEQSSRNWQIDDLNWDQYKELQELMK